MATGKGTLDYRLGYSGDTCDRLARFLLPKKLPVSYSSILTEVVNSSDFLESDLRRDLGRFTEEGWLDRRRSPDRKENF
ncbi:MAG: hypothetical protein FJ315_09195, partial [SAR202 cluster bacterium]|nr:hypothetical protein [SAR202 cluster bacterium]